jgi:hypothetical protein
LPKSESRFSEFISENESHNYYCERKKAGLLRVSPCANAREAGNFTTLAVQLAIGKTAAGTTSDSSALEVIGKVVFGRMTIDRVAPR